MGACARPLPPGTEPSPGPPPETSSRPPSDRAQPAQATFDGGAELQQLKEQGPIYVPTDDSPRIVWDTDAEALLTTRLLPVLRAESLPASTSMIVWVLVGGDGLVADVVLHTTSSNAAFDRAATDVARGLRFYPAMRGERAVPAWVIREISLVMQ